MPSNQEYKGKGMKGRNYDELSGVGTSSAGKTGTTGNLNDGGRDGGVGSPDLADSGNLQSANAGQPGGTPAQGDSWRGQGGRQDAGGGSRQSGNLGNRQSAELERRPSGHLNSRQAGLGELSDDKLRNQDKQQR
jgi:hypothetical protein